MVDLDSLPSLRDVADRHGLRARRSLGQNFLFDENLLDRIARSAGDLSGATVLEIGPGPGGLTRALLRAGAENVIALEKDRRGMDALRSLVTVADGRLTVIEGDAMKQDLATIAPGRLIVVGNLPFNIATELLMRLAEGSDQIDRMVLMFQKEVADRILAPPGASGFGRLSVITQWLCDVRRLFDIPAQAFVPPPKVQSTVIQLTPRQEPLAPAEFKDVEAITAAAFGQRRKMLRSALRSLDVDALPLLEAAGIRPDLRAETLSVEEFCALARALKAARAAKAISL